MWIPATAALLLLGGASASPRPAPMAPAPPPQADEPAKADLNAAFLALEDEYTDAYNVWRRELMASNRAPADDAGFKPEAPQPIEPAFFPRFDRMAQAGEERAQIWCLANYVSDASADEQKRDFTRRTLEVLMNPEGAHAVLPRIVSSQSMSRRRSKAPLSLEDGRALVTLVETMATAPEARSSAAYTLASMSPPQGIDPETAAAQKLQAMRSLSERYADTRPGKRARGFVFSTENLQIGMIAPDILGQDVDGHGMKLSDFRGKVTVIDFWGFW